MHVRALFLSKRAVETRISAIVLKLGMADAEDVSKRIKAALMLLAETGVKPGWTRRHGAATAPR